MHYDTRQRRPAALKHDPFKALLVPRPIGWIGSVDAKGRANLAPYSFFNGVSDRPPMVMFSSAGNKDTLRNVRESGEFTCSICGETLRDAMNLSSAAVDRGVDEFALAGLTKAPSSFVRPPRVAEAPAALECRLWQAIDLPAPPRGDAYTVVIGEVVGIYIDERYLRDGMVDTGAMRPLARLGYMDYSVVTPETMFALNRPQVGEDGRSASVPCGDWDGQYR